MKKKDKQKKSASITVALLCGGPSLERGISLNSARSVLDHLASEAVQVRPIYFDQHRRAYQLSPAQLYSNTPADFDFKLAVTAKALSPAQLERQLKRADIVFPALHGAFGEDGTIQAWLEERKIPFVGSPSVACKQAFDKFRANELIGRHGFQNISSGLLKIFQPSANRRTIQEFFTEHQLQRAIVKPASGGSSIGVFSVSTPDEAFAASQTIFRKRMDTRAVLEPFQEGREFTVIMIENRFGQPVALLPTEIETDYTEHQLFDFRKKYLPTRQVSYHCPPRFADEVVERIQLQSEQLWSLFGMHDFARFDGWVRADGSIYFSDFNPLSGMEQNSFLFQQAARIGLSHQAVLEAILARSCDRQGIRHALPTHQPASDDDTRTPLAILMGGATSERQVSLMSGTNTWLKLRRSDRYRPIPYLVDIDGGVWRVPYQLLLNHTVEEISTNCRTAGQDEARVARFERVARERLGSVAAPDPAEFGQPERLTLTEVLHRHQHVFIALHGGMGEDGQLQAALEAKDAKFNGPGSAASKLAMNKQATAEAITILALPRVSSIVGTSIALAELVRDQSHLVDRWQQLTRLVGARTMIAKPMADGCSSGVVLLRSANDLTTYVTFLADGATQIPAGTFRDQSGPIELPLTPPTMLRFERLVATDRIRTSHHQLRRTRRSGFVEITMGVIEQRGALHAFAPSLTVAEGTVLSVEEKFQGGTGVNLTPPPVSILPARIRRHVQQSLATVAERLGLRGYCRIDAFVHTGTGQILVIEVNSLPALTPSTVLFQQALADSPPRSPRELLELIADNKS